MSNRRNAVRFGRGKAFTLVELLVVIAIIGILVSLLLPAVQAAREAARRMQCSNNLKQLSLAALNYESTYSCLPACAIGLTTPPHNPRGYLAYSNGIMTWGIAILPFIEQSSLYEMYDETIVGMYNQSPEFYRAKVATFKCPSDIPDDLVYVNFPYNRPVQGKGGFSATSYAANAGGTVWGSAGALASAYDHPMWMIDGGVPFKAWSGPFSIVIEPYTSFPTLGEVTDGTSNTFCLGESHVSKKPGEIDIPMTAKCWTYGFYNANWSSVFQGETPLNRHTMSFDECVATGRSNYACQRGGWGANHPAGMNIAMTDGSVQFISETVNIDVFFALATKGNGETVSLP